MLFTPGLKLALNSKNQSLRPKVLFTNYGFWDRKSFSPTTVSGAERASHPLRFFCSCPPVCLDPITFAPQYSHRPCLPIGPSPSVALSPCSLVSLSVLYPLQPCLLAPLPPNRSCFSISPAFPSALSPSTLAFPLVLPPHRSFIPPSGPVFLRACLHAALLSHSPFTPL